MKYTVSVSIPKSVISKSSKVGNGFWYGVTEESYENSSHRLLSVVYDEVDTLCHQVVLCIVLCKLSLLTRLLLDVHIATLKVPCLFLSHCLIVSVYSMMEDV